MSKTQRKALKQLKNDKQMKVYPLDKGIGYSLLDDIDDVSKTEEQLGKSKLLIMTPQNLLKENFLKLLQKLKKKINLVLTNLPIRLNTTYIVRNFKGHINNRKTTPLEQ